MMDDPRDDIEVRLREAGRALHYPPTPDVTALLRARRAPRRQALRWAALAAATLLAALLAIPEVRAAALVALRIGAVRIAPTPEPALPTALPAGAAPIPPPTAVPPTQAAAPRVGGLGDLRGATTLAEAEAHLGRHLRLPTAPGIGPPDAVFAQDLGGPAAILVWGDTQRPRMALFVLSSDAYAEKVGVESLEATTVGGRPAAWTTGPYLLQVEGAGGQLALRRTVEGHTLIWEEGGLTYRLECGLSLEEAVRVAESLR